MTAEVCPCCGQTIAPSFTAEQLLAAMKRRGPRATSPRSDATRQLYRVADSGKWTLTFGTFPDEPHYFVEATVATLIKSRKIKPPRGYCGGDYYEIA